MTTSNQTVFELTRDQIISAALRKLLVLGDDQGATATQLANGTQALNAITATFQSLGMPLWKRTELPITMVAGQRDYNVGIGRTIAVPFPLHIHEATLNLPNSNSEISVNMLSRYDFNMLPSTSNGVPVNATYQPYINYGVFSVWPTPDASTLAGTIVTITYQAPFQYFIGSTDTPDFPQEWINALIYALAVSLAPENGVPLMDRSQLSKEADQHLVTVLGNGGEDGSIYFGVDRN